MVYSTLVRYNILEYGIFNLCKVQYTRIWHILPTEARKRQKMFFTHTAGGIIYRESRGGRSVVCFVRLPDLKLMFSNSVRFLYGLVNNFSCY